MKWAMQTFMRKRSAGVLGVVNRYCALAAGQPLLLTREPENPNDMNAVRVSDLMNQPVGYIAREHALEVGRKMAEGNTVLAKTIGECACVQRDLFLWIDGEEEEKKDVGRLLLLQEER